MAQAFNLTAQLQLQAPGNTNQVINQIRRQLKPIGVQIKLQNTKNLAQSSKALGQFNKNARSSNKSMGELNRTLQESARRFSVITIATGSFLALANAFKNSVKEAVAFERELVRISQVTGKSVRELRSLSDEVTRLSTSLGASSKDLLSVARTLSQAGFAAEDTKRALDILAKTSLGATFDSIQETTEGAIALLRQFGNEARASGGDIAFLEKSLDAINSVSKKFAVESGDLISVIRRTGGVFAAAGGSVNELIALFTSVRATTRESAETIATGLRTIFTRIQRTETIQQLKALNIELQDSQGQFVGAFEAVRRLSVGLSALNPRDFRFSQIVEELGGFRQIGKVIPLIQQFTTAQQALNVAQGASGSVSKDAATAQQSLGVQIQKVRENFDALLRKFADSSSFRSIAGFALKLADSFIKIAEALEPLLPLLTSLTFLKLGQGLAPAVASFAGIGRRAGGVGTVSKFARGGMVPGSGNRDTVPAMLTPGEFVIRKSSVNKIGAGTLAAMNQNRYAKGGIADLGNKPAKTRFINNKKEIVGMDQDTYYMPDSTDRAVEISKQSYQQLRGKGRGWEEWLANRSTDKDRPKGLPAGKLTLNRQSGYPVDFTSDSGRIYDAKDLTEGSISDIAKAKKSLNYAFIKALKGSWKWSGRPQSDPIQYGGQGFGTSNKILSPNKDQINLQPLTLLYPKIVNKEGEALNLKKEQATRTQRNKNKQEKPMATGGGISGSDTVPALLTPGEFVFSKSAARGIGYGNLNRMNKHGVRGYAKGGPVAVQKFASGSSGPVSAARTDDEVFFGLPKKSMKELVDIVDELSAKFEENGESVSFSTEKVEESGGKFSAFAGKLNAAAGAAQSFVFVGSAVTSVTAQMSDLSETTKEAINQTAAFVSGFVGIGGTLVQILTSVATAEAVQVATTSANTVAEVENTVATKLETNAKLKNASASLGATAMIGNVAIGFLAGLTALTYFKNKAVAEANALSDGVEEAINKMRETGQGSAEDQKTSIKRAIEARNTADLYNINPLKDIKSSAINLTAAGAGAYAGGSLGAKAGSLFGGPGIAIGLGLGALAGGIGGALAPGQVGEYLGLDEIKDAQKEQVDNINKTIDGLVSLTSSLRDLEELSSELSKAESLGVSNEEIVQRGLSAVGSQLNGNNLSQAKAANDSLKKLAESAEKTMTSLTEADFADNAAGLEQFKLATMQARFAQESAAKIVEQAGSTLQKAFQDVDPSKTFEELINLGGPFAQAYEQNIAAIKAESRVRAIEIKARLDDINREIANNRGSGEEYARLVNQRTAIEEELQGVLTETNQALRDTETGYRNSQTARNEEYIALQKSKAEQIALAQSIAETNAFLKELNNIELNLEKQSVALDNFAAVIENTAIKIQASSIDEIGDVSQVRDLDKFSAQVSGLTSRFGPKAKEIGDQVVQAAKVFSNAQSLIGQNFSTGDPIQPEKILKDLGLTADILGDGGDIIFKQIVASLQDIQGQISPSDVEKIFAPLLEVTRKNADNISRLSGINQKEIDNYVKYLDVKEQQRQREISQKEQEIEASARNAELINNAQRLLATSREREFSGLDPNVKQAQRLQLAQNSLQGFSAGGQQLRAGDLAQISSARKAAIEERKRIVQDIEAGNTTKENIKRQKQLQLYIDATTKELERMSDQSARATDIFSSMEENNRLIEKEKAKRQQLIGVLEEFVVGGQDTRKQLLQASAGIRQAFATGTLQFQSPEQRSLTVGLLDKLSDIELAPGMTGREIKQQLVFNDAAAFFGANSPIAMALATSMSEEEKLIQANETLATEIRKLTLEMSQATAAMMDQRQPAAAGKASGGIVQYRADGGSIFQPRGTDTVPAMLTPGEFVIRKSAVDKVGVGALSAINNGANVVQNFQTGGMSQSISGSEKEKVDRLMSDEELAQFGIQLPGRQRGRTSGLLRRNVENRAKRTRASKINPVGEAFDVAQKGVHYASYVDPTGILNFGNAAVYGARSGLAAVTGGDSESLAGRAGSELGFGATSLLGSKVISGVANAAKAKSAARAATAARDAAVKQEVNQLLGGMGLGEIGGAGFRAADALDPMVRQTVKYGAPGNALSQIGLRTIDTGKSGMRYGLSARGPFNYNGTFVSREAARLYSSELGLAGGVKTVSLSGGAKASDDLIAKSLGLDDLLPYRPPSPQVPSAPNSMNSLLGGNRFSDDVINDVALNILSRDASGFSRAPIAAATKSGIYSPAMLKGAKKAEESALEWIDYGSRTGAETVLSNTKSAFSRLFGPKPNAATAKATGTMTGVGKNAQYMKKVNQFGGTDELTALSSKINPATGQPFELTRNVSSNLGRLNTPSTDPVNRFFESQGRAVADLASQIFKGSGSAIAGAPSAAISGSRDLLLSAIRSGRANAPNIGVNGIKALVDFYQQNGGIMDMELEAAMAEASAQNNRATSVSDFIKFAESKDPQAVQRIREEIQQSPWLLEDREPSASKKSRPFNPRSFDEANEARINAVTDKVMSGSISGTAAFTSREVQQRAINLQQQVDNLPIDELEKAAQEEELIRSIIIEQEKQKIAQQKQNALNEQRKKAREQYDEMQAMADTYGLGPIFDDRGGIRISKYEDLAAVERAGKAKANSEAVNLQFKKSQEQMAKNQKMVNEARQRSLNPPDLKKEREKKYQEEQREKFKTQLYVWTDKSGTYETRGYFHGIQGDAVRILKKDGSTVDVPLDRLSDTSRSNAESNASKTGPGYFFGGGFVNPFAMAQAGQNAMYRQAQMGQNAMFNRAAAGQRFMMRMANPVQYFARPGMSTNTITGEMLRQMGVLDHDWRTAVGGNGLPRGAVPMKYAKAAIAVAKKRISQNMNANKDPDKGRGGVSLQAIKDKKIDGVSLTSLLDYSTDYSWPSIPGAIEEFFRLREQGASSESILQGYTKRGASQEALKKMFNYVSDIRNISGVKLASGGGVPYFATGGSSGGDSVPAMLTPGEFVMSVDSVKKHGVGFMESLNRGNVPGFNKGGMVQYRQDGGLMGMIGGAAKSFGIDTSKIEGVFGGFVDNFSSVFDNILLPFNGIMQGLQNIADKFGNFVMSHEVKPITVLIPNLDTLDGKIASAVEKAIKDALPKTNNNKDFKSNGN